MVVWRNIREFIQGKNHTSAKNSKKLLHKIEFIDGRKFKEHLRIHSGDKPYPCNRCPKAFSDCGNLKKHVIIHSGQRPYSCNQCPKAFNEREVQRHIWEFIQQKSIHLKSVTQSFFIWWKLKELFEKSFREKNKPLQSMPKSIFTRWEFIEGRNHTVAINAQSIYQILEIWRNIWEFIQGRNNTYAISVPKFS